MTSRHAHQTSLLSYIAVAGAVMLAAIALDRRMCHGRQHARPDPTDGKATPHQQQKPRSAVAFSARAAAAAGERAQCDVIRPAGQDAMRDPPSNWDSVDEMVDESFPASDPPGRY